MMWSQSFRSGFLLRLLPGVALLFAAFPLEAQYFGRNKVQYESFDFRVLKTEHFDINFYPPEEAAAGHAARMSERWYARLSSILDHELSGRPFDRPGKGWIWQFELQPGF